MDINLNPQYQKIITVLGKDRVKLDELLSKHTTFRIGGPADLFYEANNNSEIRDAVTVARKNDVSYFILGGGSNLLVADSGYRGLVIKTSNSSWKVQKINNSRFLVYVEAGTNLQTFVRAMAGEGLAGLEFATGIPGMVGGAVRGNAGAWLQAIGDLLTRVLVLNKKGETTWLKPEECDFRYRSSRFKTSGDIILAAELVLLRGDPDTIRAKMADIILKRSTQPTEPSAGCVFVNPKPRSAGQLIDQCLLKGVKCGNAEISPKHANFVVNQGNAKAKDVYSLIQQMKTKVKAKFGVDLIEEIQLVGFDITNESE